MNERRTGPVMIEVEGETPSPAEAPPLPEAGAPPAMERAIRAQAATGAGTGTGAGGWALRALGALLTLALSVAAWDFVTGLLARNAVLGGLAAGLAGVALLALLVFALREIGAIRRLTRVEGLRDGAGAARTTGDAGAARAVVARLRSLYAGRADMDWALARMRERAADTADAEGLLAMAETELMPALDRAATAEVEAAARQVAAVTALMPLALADVAVALAANLRMIRRVATIYGGRTGGYGSLRLMRRVFAHLIATGAVAVGDDMIGSVAGGGLMSKLSRRFGEGVVNGALTARVGVAAIEVCRPLPFHALPRPRVHTLLSGAVTGLFSARPGG
ncbi:MAG: TIGR01620 family protein [Gemmobacter sp.]